MKTKAKKNGNYQQLSTGEQKKKKAAHTMDYSAYKINIQQGNKKHTQQINETAET